MASFADFAKRIVALQVDYYEQTEGEYNQDPFSVWYKTRMSTERVFGLCESEDQPEAWTSLHASRRLKALAVQFEDSLASEEHRQRALFRKHCETLAQKEQELVDIQYAEESGDPLSSILSGDPLIKNALLEYRRYGLGDLCYVSNAHVLAVVCPVSKKWFFPQKLPTPIVRLHPSLFSSGDTMGSIEQDEGIVSRCHVPDALRIPTDRQPLWFSNLLAFHPEELLQSTPWTVPDQEDSTRSLFDPGQELIRAMVVTRQVSAFLGREDGFSADSYARVDRLHATFYQLVKTQFVNPALENARQRFHAGDWSNFCLTALQHLPVVRPCKQDEEEEDVECVLTGKRKDLLRVTVVRCPVLEWDSTVKSFKDHIDWFTCRYTGGQQRWWQVATQRLSFRSNPRNGTRRRRSSLSCTSSVSGAPEINSRHRGRRTVIQVSNNCQDADDDDFEGFLVGPWTNSLILHRSVVDLLGQAWRLAHLNWWIDLAFLRWKKDKSTFHSTNQEAIFIITNAICAALSQCQTSTGSW